MMTSDVSSACVPESEFPLRLREQRQRPAFFLARGGPERQVGPRAVRASAADGVVLLGQDLRRRHERSLKAGFDREQHRGNRHHGFARADIALQQTVHRMMRRQIAPDFCDHFLLRVGQIKRERAQKFLEQLPSPAMGIAHSHTRFGRAAKQSTFASRKTPKTPDARAPQSCASQLSGK